MQIVNDVQAMGMGMKSKLPLCTIALISAGLLRIVDTVYSFRTKSEFMLGSCKKNYVNFPKPFSACRDQDTKYGHYCLHLEP